MSVNRYFTVVLVCTSLLVSTQPEVKLGGERAEDEFVLGGVGNVQYLGALQGEIHSARLMLRGEAI